MPTLRFPLVGSFSNRRDAVNFTGDQVFINCFPEVVRNPITGKSTVYLSKRPGSAKGAALTGVDSACKSGAIITWAGQTASEPIPAAAFLNTGGTSTSVWNMKTDAKIGGDIASTDDCTCLTETTISGTANLVGNFYDSGTGALEQWYYPEGGAWTQVTDGDFPSDVVGFPVHMDGYVFNMTRSGKVYNSDLNSVSSYTAANYFSSNAYPDKGVTVARLGQYVAAFGERSIELLGNKGNSTGSPLSRVVSIPMGATRTQTSGGIGKTTRHSVLQAKGTIYWIGTNSEGAPTGIYRFNGQAPEKISNATIDRMIGAGQISGFVGSFYFSGSHHIALTTGGSASNWAYSINDGFWWKFVLASGNLLGAIGTADSQLSMTGLTRFTTSANARNNVDLSPTSSNNLDDGSAYTMTVQTENMAFDTRKLKVFNRIDVECDKQAAASALGVSWSDDDYATFSTARDIDMSTAQTWITSLGSADKRAWKFTHSAATPCRIQAVEIEYELGT